MPSAKKLAANEERYVLTAFLEPNGHTASVILGLYSQLCTKQSLKFLEILQKVHFDYKPSLASDHLINTLNEAYSSDRLAPMSTFIMDVGSPFFKFSTPFSYTTITHKVFTVHFAHSMMYFSSTTSFCLQETDYTS